MLERLRHHLAGNRFIRRLLMLSGGTAVGQGLLVLSSPLLTRLYTPEEFGLFAIFSALSAILGVMIALRYEFAVPIAKHDKEAAELVAVAAFVTFLACLLLCMLLWFLASDIALVLGAAELASYLWILPPSLLLWGIGSALYFWMIRKGHFRLNSINRTIQFGSQAIAQVLLGLVALGGLGLILGYVLGYLTRFAHLATGLSRGERSRLCRPTVRGMRRALCKHWRYPAFSASSSVLQSISQMLPAVLVAMLFGPAMAGWFALAQRVVALPVRLLGDSASQVFLGEIANAEPQRLMQLFKRTTGLFLIVGVIGMLPLMLLGPWLFALLFGEPWREAGVIVQILVPLHLARFVATPISQTLNVLQRQDLHLVTSLIGALALLVSFGTGWWLGLDAHATLALFSFVTCAAFAFYIGTTWYQLRCAQPGDPKAP